jgi:microcystin-dependent protein
MKRSQIKRRLTKNFLAGFAIALGLIGGGLLAVAVTGTFNTFSSGGTIKAADINANFATLKTTIEGINAGSSPEGAIIAFGGTTAPTGWLLCNGQTVSRSTYSALYSVIGNSFGAGDGSTTFHLPDLRGRFLRGVDSIGTNDPDSGTRTAMNSGGNTGNGIGSIQLDMIKNHQHDFDHWASDNASPSYGTNDFTVGNNHNSYRTGHKTGNPITGAGGSETRPKNAYVNFIIKH